MGGHSERERSASRTWPRSSLQRIAQYQGWRKMRAQIRALLTAVGRRIEEQAASLGRRLLGSRTTRRFVWARWGLVRLRAASRGKPILRRVLIEWDVPGHARAVTSEITGPGSGDVVVRTIASAVSPGTERASFRMDAGSLASFPSLPGYSLSGEVWRVGRRVKDLRPGALVATQAPHASAVVRPADLVFQLPEGVPAEDGALLFFGIIVLHGLWLGQLQHGDRVAVLGRGPLGHLTVQLARALGAGDVISISPSRQHVTAVLEHMATRVIVTSEDPEGTLDELDADVTVEASGHPDAPAEAVRVTRREGRVVLLGSPRQVSSFNFGSLAARQISLVGAHISTLPSSPTFGRTSHREAAETFLHLLEEQRLDLRGLIGAEVNPWEAGLFYRRLARQRPAWVAALFRWDWLEETERIKRVSFWEPPEMDLVSGRTLRRLPLNAMPRTLITRESADRSEIG
jgi:2-desacetyl-2-hydroxyethyl bacteriochlorophyllide A dehydrogenase